MTDAKTQENIQTILFELNEKFDHRLQITSPLDQLPSDLRQLLSLCYQAKTNKPRNSYFAAILNGIYTENLSSFLMSQNLLQELIKNDPNIERNTVDSKSYREFMAFMLNKGYVRLLSKPERIAKGSKPIAGKWEWTHEPTLAILKPYLGERKKPQSVPENHQAEKSPDSGSTPSLEQEAKQKILNSALERNLYAFCVGGSEHSEALATAESLIKNQKYADAISLLDSIKMKRDQIYPGARTYTIWKTKTLDEAVQICRREKPRPSTIPALLVANG